MIASEFEVVLPQKKKEKKVNYLKNSGLSFHGSDHI